MACSQMILNGLRDFIMWLAIGVLLVAGLIVGKDHFNKTIEEILCPK